jgi:ribonuclease HI
MVSSNHWQLQVERGWLLSWKAWTLKCRWCPAKPPWSSPLYFFSLPVEILDSNIAELRAVVKAIELSALNCLLHHNHITIKSDSANVISWMHNSHNRPWMHWELFSTVQRLTRFFGSITFSHVYRESNSLANCMVKQGVRRSCDFIAWFWSISQLIFIRLLKVLHFRGSDSLERWIGDSWKFPLDFVVMVILCRFQCCYLS